METAAAAAAAAAADAAAHTAAEARFNGQDFNGRTRLHELKAHFHQFGDVVEVALMGKKV